MSWMHRRVSLPLGPLVAGLAVLLVVAVVTWFREAEARKVASVCESWLEHRGALDTVIQETAVAVERLDDPGDRRPGSLALAYDDVEQQLSALGTWIAIAPDLREQIDDWEVDASQAIKHSLSNARQLRATIQGGEATEVAGHDAELAAENLRATQEWLRDSCGTAWRRL